MRIAGIEPESIVDGPGVRYAVFAQGCSLHCRGCQNPASWDPCGGAVMPVEEIMADMRASSLAQGLTLTGGEASDSERDLSVRGVDSVPAGVLGGIDYLALGHLHGCQDLTARVGAPAWYSGSPPMVCTSNSRSPSGPSPARTA